MSDRYRYECPDGCKVFVGNLSRNTSRGQLEDIFGRFGKLRNIWMASTPPGFAFIMYEYRSDARRAVFELNDTQMDGRFVTVELATGCPRYGDNGQTSTRGHRPRVYERRDTDYGNRGAERRSDCYSADRKPYERTDRRSTGLRDSDRSPNDRYNRYSRERRHSTSNSRSVSPPKSGRKRCSDSKPTNSSSTHRHNRRASKSRVRSDH